MTTLQSNAAAIAVEPQRARPSSLVTLRRPEFVAACRELMRLVAADYLPTLVIGVRTGGFVVAEAMVSSTATPLPLLPLTCRRAGTDAKARLPFLRTVLAKLPRPAIDLLRTLEHRLVTARRRRRSPMQQIDHRELDAIAGWLVERALPQRILVVDDAVDSGVTLATTLQYLGRVCPPETEIRTAVITHTTSDSCAIPDYSLFRGILCRFPWSFDAAN